jgi:hypothetical protein
MQCLWHTVFNMLGFIDITFAACLCCMLAGRVSQAAGPGRHTINKSTYHVTYLLLTSPCPGLAHH